jgi:hypothetical protein
MRFVTDLIATCVQRALNLLRRHQITLSPSRRPRGATHARDRAEVRLSQDIPGVPN